MLDEDLALLYGVSTMRLNEQVKRNLRRFPADFMFQLTDQEYATLISQIAISKTGRGGRRKAPFAFTEQGIAMLSAVLHSDRAIDVNIEIMRAFVRLRHLLSAYKDLEKKIHTLENKYDHNFKVVFDAIKKLSLTHTGDGRGLSVKILFELLILFSKPPIFMRNFKTLHRQKTESEITQGRRLHRR